MSLQQLLRWSANLAPALLIGGAAITPAYGQQPYPARPIRLIASQSAGGGVDAVARLAAARLTEAFGQNVIVDNRPGANGTLAGDITAQSPPDGYTLLLGALGNLVINGFFSKIGYDPLKDLAPVTTAISSGNLLVVHPSVPATSVKELIAIARARPGQLAYGSSGTAGQDISRARCSSAWRTSSCCTCRTKAARPRSSISWQGKRRSLSHRCRRRCPA